MCQPADGPAFVHHQPMQCMRTGDFALLRSNEGPMCDGPLRNLAPYGSNLAGLHPRFVEEDQTLLAKDQLCACDRLPRNLAGSHSDFASLQQGLVEEGQAPIAKDQQLFPFMKSCSLLDEQSSKIWRKHGINGGIIAQTGYRFEADTGKGPCTYFKDGVRTSLKRQASAKSTSASEGETSLTSASFPASTWASDIADAIHVNPDDFSNIRGKSRSVEGKSPWAPDSIWDGIMCVSSHKDQRRAFDERNIPGPMDVRQCAASASGSEHDVDSFSDAGPAVLDCGPGS